MGKQHECQAGLRCSVWVFGGSHEMAVPTFQEGSGGLSRFREHFWKVLLFTRIVLPPRPGAPLAVCPVSGENSDLSSFISELSRTACCSGCICGLRSGGRGLTLLRSGSTGRGTAVTFGDSKPVIWPQQRGMGHSHSWSLSGDLSWNPHHQGNLSNCWDTGD